MVRLNYLVLITILFTPISSLASNDVGYKYYERGNFKKALEIWSIEAKNGNGEAFYNMGLLYYFGNGVKKDLSIAYRYCKKAAFKGLPRAQNNLAFMYTKGRGIEKSYIHAYDWSLIAIKHGYNSHELKDDARIHLTPAILFDSGKLFSVIMKEINYE